MALLNSTWHFQSFFAFHTWSSVCLLSKTTHLSTPSPSSLPFSRTTFTGSMSSKILHSDHRLSREICQGREDSVPYTEKLFIFRPSVPREESISLAFTQIPEGLGTWKGCCMLLLFICRMSLRRRADSKARKSKFWNEWNCIRPRKVFQTWNSL